ncbi:hypothetical protein [Cryptosporangium japonicum]|uniref:Secreted protein n=1 Tax=Cryptosporangium japonicum TaxID=80872 RepID=A0ABP3EAW6_9ACTN
MRATFRLLVAVGLTGAAIVIPGQAATADPCGASSYKSGSTQYVAYRNCGESVSRRMRGVIDGSRGPCLQVPGATSGVLHSKNIGSASLRPWDLVGC